MSVQGWERPAFVAPGALGGAGHAGCGHRNVLLSPFDSLTWDRARTERTFGFQHRLEAYVPRDKRRYGYFAMPVLGGNRLVGLVDPGRRGDTLVAKQITLHAPHAAPQVAAALAEAASWVGATWMDRAGGAGDGPGRARGSDDRAGGRCSGLAGWPAGPVEHSSGI